MSHPNNKENTSAIYWCPLKTTSIKAQYHTGQHSCSRVLGTKQNLHSHLYLENDNSFSFNFVIVSYVISLVSNLVSINYYSRNLTYLEINNKINHKRKVSYRHFWFLFFELAPARIFEMKSSCAYPLIACGAHTHKYMLILPKHRELPPFYTQHIVLNQAPNQPT